MAEQENGRRGSGRKACSICRNPTAKALVDGALAGGDRPLAVYKKHGAALGVSQSAVYRHARNHLGPGKLSVDWLGDSMSGEVVADLAFLSRSFVAQRKAALERGDSQIAASEGRAAMTAMQNLLKIGIEDDSMSEKLEYSQRLVRSVQRAIRNRPQMGSEISSAARELDDEEMARDLDRLVDSAVDYNTKVAE